MEKLLAESSDFAKMLKMRIDSEEPFFSQLQVRSAQGIDLQSAPAFDAPVVAKVAHGRKVSAQAHRGLWLKVLSGSTEGWLHAYKSKENACDMTVLKISAWEPQR
eukprot:TRINITY_DN15591_c0_g1_i1.p1 TRINITY_DN15591_c0_g1~~TRINITY_DN15591_c0_g1_i1.p1  ORF type:complete len:105 (-),score=20.41 TRINITY_DN15591_c0_g1_i1:119-433(-)